MILLVNLVFVALARSGHDHAVPVLDLLALHVGEYNLKQVTITFAHHYVGDIILKGKDSRFFQIDIASYGWGPLYKPVY